MERYARELDLTRGPVTSSQQRYDHTGEPHGARVYEGRLPTDAALSVFDLVEAEGLPVQVYEDDTIKSRVATNSPTKTRSSPDSGSVVENFRAMIASGRQKLVIGDPMLLAPWRSSSRPTSATG
jgi:hypothetical protein